MFLSIFLYSLFLQRARADHFAAKAAYGYGAYAAPAYGYAGVGYH